jgi:hypothetical protein
MYFTVAQLVTPSKGQSKSQTILIRILDEGCKFGHTRPRKRVAGNALEHVTNDTCVYTLVQKGYCGRRGYEISDRWLQFLYEPRFMRRERTKLIRVSKAHTKQVRSIPT